MGKFGSLTTNEFCEEFAGLVAQGLNDDEIIQILENTSFKDDSRVTPIQYLTAALRAKMVERAEDHRDLLLDVEALLHPMCVEHFGEERCECGPCRARNKIQSLFTGKDDLYMVPLKKMLHELGLSLS